MAEGRASRMFRRATSLRGKIAAGFLGTQAPASLIDKMAASYLRNGYSIGAAVKTMALAPEFARAGTSLAPPERFVFGALRFGFDQKTITNP